MKRPPHCTLRFSSFADTSSAQNLRFICVLTEQGIALATRSALLLARVNEISLSEATFLKKFTEDVRLYVSQRNTLTISKEQSNLIFENTEHAAYDARVAAHRAEQAAFSIRALIGNLGMPLLGEINFSGDGCLTMLEVQSHIEQLDRYTSKLSFLDTSSAKAIQTLRSRIAEMLTIIRINTAAAMRAAEASDKLTAHACGFANAVENSELFE